jgi:hypothetical protein
MAPVATTISYGEKDGFVLFLGFFKSLITPRIPIDRIVGMLLEVWRVFIFESV